MSSITRLTVIAALAGTAALAVGVAFRRVDLVDRLSAVHPPRTFLPRLSIESEYRPCTVAPGAQQIPVGRCPAGGADLRELTELSPTIYTRLRREVTPETLHAGSLLDLLAAPGERSLDRAISSLESASRLSPDSAPILNDLAAGLLLRAQTTQSARDAAEAIEVTEHAMKLAPRDPAVLFNRALALEAWQLNDIAAAAWHDYLSIDRNSPWADEARRHLGAAEAPSVVQERLDANPTPDQVRAYAARTPEAAWDSGWRSLAEWSDARLRGDTASAVRALGLAEELGRALQAQGGDHTLADAALDIARQGRDTAAVRQLAESHQAYATARAEMDQVAYLRAMGTFRSLLDRHPPSPALAAWARQGYAAALVGTSKLPAADSALQPLERGLDREANPILAGRVRWTRATVELRLNHPDRVLEPAHEAADLLLRAGAPGLAAGALYVAADGESGIGASFAAYADARVALGHVGGALGSTWRCNALATAARTALADGLVGTALRFQDERVQAAMRNGHPQYLAEALAGRAQMRAAAGDPAGALRDAWLGEHALADVASGPGLAKLRGDLQVARAMAYLRSEPRSAEAITDSMVSSALASRLNGAPRLFQALVLSARAKLALRDAPGAATDLDSAVRVLVPHRADVLALPLRISLAETARAAFDQLVMLRLDAADTLGALKYLEQGRVSLGDRRTSAAAGARADGNTVMLDYALIGDTLLLWVIRDGRPRLFRTHVHRDDLAARIDRLDLQLERGDGEASVRPELEWLHDLLVRPVSDQLGGNGSRIVIVADGELAGVPFAALFDRRTRRYLVDEYVIRDAPSVADATAPVRPLAAPRGVTIVSNPAFDARAYPDVERLAWSEAEGDSIARLYPRSDVISGSRATHAAVWSALGTAEIFHFTGHALFDPGRPERSALVLAPQPGTRGPSPLNAFELDSVDLRGTRLIVLSACETMRASAGRGRAFAGFAAAFLNAGAGGVVGGSWQVDDRASNRLMVEFHRAYRATGDGAASLQAAQKKLLHSGRPEWSSPSAWAAFRYAGN